jgi:DNA-binding helix-hairpin-helix protein with protein kinase domain
VNRGDDWPPDLHEETRRPGDAPTRLDDEHSQSLMTTGAAGGVTDRMFLGHRNALILGATLARAGEGTIREVVGHPDWIAKIFHADLRSLADKKDKVAVMVHSPPPAAVQPDGFVVLAWPLHLVHGKIGEAGYVMARVDTTDAVEIHQISNPSNRANPLPTAPQWIRYTTWRHLVDVAANLCLAVQAVHQTSAVIGDFQERNIFVSNTCRVTLVDCDSMQFTDPSGRQFLCGVGRPEFSAPELASIDLSRESRALSSDLFALAVHMHLLLMGGNHPFLRGAWIGVGDQPDALELARRGQWAGGPESMLHTHPLAPPPTFLPPDIRHLFVRAFSEGAHTPAARPTAAEWRQALLAICVTTCASGRHEIPSTCLACPWCRIDEQRAHRRGMREPAGHVAAQTISKIEPPSTPMGVAAVQRSDPLVAGSARAPGRRGRPSRRSLVFASAGVLTLLIAGVAAGIVMLVTATQPARIKTMPMIVDVAPAGAAVCPIGADQAYRHIAVTPPSKCAEAGGIIAAANASSVVASGSADNIHLRQQAGADATLHCSMEQVMTCRGGGMVAYLW